MADAPVLSGMGRVRAARAPVARIRAARIHTARIRAGRAPGGRVLAVSESTGGDRQACEYPALVAGCRLVPVVVPRAPLSALPRDGDRSHAEQSPTPWWPGSPDSVPSGYSSAASLRSPKEQLAPTVLTYCAPPVQESVRRRRRRTDLGSRDCPVHQMTPVQTTRFSGAGTSLSTQVLDTGNRGRNRRMVGACQAQRDYDDTADGGDDGHDDGDSVLRHDSSVPGDWLDEPPDTAPGDTGPRSDVIGWKT